MIVFSLKEGVYVGGVIYCNPNDDGILSGFWEPESSLLFDFITKGRNSSVVRSM